MTTPSKWRLRQLREDELDALYTTRIEKDFPSAERPNLAAMHRHMREGLQDIFIMSGNGEDVAYAVCAEENGLALITLLAVYPGLRGGGYGTLLLTLLAAQYANRRGILLEVENPAQAADEADRATREKRIAFYLRAGYVPLEGIEHESFGVSLLLMVLPLADTIDALRATAVGDTRALFDKILPPALRPNITTRRIDA